MLFWSKGFPVSDVNVRIPEEAKNRLAAAAAAEGMSLRSYLAHLATTVLTPAERAQRAEQARARLRAWTGYDPTPEEDARLGAELERRVAQALDR